ncbi:ProQ/FINO family protein [Agrobacterium radiobacter]|uniref:ProQ/FINO family protein n=1 Tax=Agrobacterium radiobacter TaxID=362 RepID=UPI003F8649D8
MAVLPSAEGETVLPFRIGINNDIVRLLRPGAALSDLRKALRRYTHSAANLYATAQPDVLLIGQPFGAVSDEDRLNARQTFLIVQERRKRRREPRESEKLAQN